jgi:hypothetical protein
MSRLSMTKGKVDLLDSNVLIAVGSDQLLQTR